MMESPAVAAAVNSNNNAISANNPSESLLLNRDAMNSEETNGDAAVQLLDRIFQMCDVERRGQISIDDLLQLGQSYLGQETNKDLADALRSLADPLGDGMLTFDDFCRGVSSIIQSAPPSSSEGILPLDTSTPEKQKVRTLIDWSELTMPLAVEQSGSAGEDFIVETGAAVNGRQRRVSDDSGYSPKSNSPTDTVPVNGSVSSGCSSMSEREISFEAYGEADLSIDNGLDSNDTPPPNLGNRSTWMNGMLRSSIRRSDYNSGGEAPFQRRYGSLRLPGKRGIGSNAQASQLYPKNSNRSEDHADFCSDASLEDDVVDLGNKVQILQQQITALADTQYGSDDRYSRSKQENAALTARLQMLEESLRDVELRAAQQLTEEQRRNKELIVRVEREKQLEIENCTIKLQAAERELELMREETNRLKSQADRLRAERASLQQRLGDTEQSFVESQEENRQLAELVKRERDQWALESATSKQITAELSREVDLLRDLAQYRDRDSTSARLQELENEIKLLRQDNNDLRESNDELQAQLFSRGLEEGRTLLNDHLANNSLAAEFEVMSQDDIRTALKEQQEVNAQLRSYIEGILLTIVENQPSLLEKKPPAPNV